MYNDNIEKLTNASLTASTNRSGDSFTKSFACWEDVDHTKELWLSLS